MNTVRVQMPRESSLGDAGGWSKHVTGVDSSKDIAWPFLGEWLHSGETADLPVGAIIIQSVPAGMPEHLRNSARALRVRADGTLEQVAQSSDWAHDLLEFRNVVAALIT